MTDIDFEIDFNESEDLQSRFYLCHPSDRHTIAEMKYIKNRKLTENFGGINELSFTVPLWVTSDGGKQIRNNLFDLIRGDYLIRMEQGNKKEYYIVCNPESNGGEKEEKHITCRQQHYEWKDKIVRGFKGTLPLYDPLGTEGVLNRTLLAKTDYSIDYVAGSLTNKYRTFDESERNLLEFTLDSIERYGDYIPVVDTVNKKVSIFESGQVGKNEGLEVAYGKYLKSLTETENFEEVTTRLYLYGKDNISVTELNPSGLDYLESFEFYMYGYAEDVNGNVISHSLYMSDGLCKAINNYNNLLLSKTSVFQNYLTQKEAHQITLTTKGTELRNLEDEIEVIERLIDLAISTNNNLTELNQQKAIKQSQITAKKAEITVVEGYITTIDVQIAALRNEISIPNNFTPDQIKERNRFIKEKVWQDSNYSSAIDLYNEGKARLLRLSQPLVSYKVDMIDLLSALNVPYDRNKLKLGTIITIQYPNLGIRIEAKIIIIEHDIDSNQLNLTIANNKDLKTGFLKIKELLNNSVSVGAQVDMSRFKWDLSESNNTDLNRIMTNKWDATKQAVVAGKDENVDISERGITLTNINDSNKILRMLSSTIAMTNDGGNTYKLGIDAGGVIAESLYGVILAGQNLTIQNTSGTFSVDGNGARVSDMDLTITHTLNKFQIKLNAADGIKVQKNISTQANPVWSDQISLDGNGDALFGGNVVVGTGNDILKITSQGLQLGHSTFASAPFRADMLGNVTMNKLTANSANITDSQISKGAIIGSSINIGNGNFTVNTEGQVVAKNLTIMGGSISWGSGGVNSDPTIATAQGTANFATSIAQAIAAGTYTGGTFISDRIIYAPDLRGGSITSNTTIDVGTDLKVGNNIYVGEVFSSGMKSIFLKDLSYIRTNGDTIMISCSANFDIRIGGQVLVNGSPLTAKFA